jgi:HEAT repeat protein
MRALIVAVFALAVLGAGLLLIRKSNGSHVVAENTGPLLISSADEGWDWRAKKAIESAGTNALPSLLALIAEKGDTGRTSRQLALAGFEALRSNGAPAVPALIRLLRDPQLEVRSVAIGCLQAIGPTASNAVPDLLGCLNDSDAEIRRSVVFALGDIPGNGEVVVPALISYLEQPHPDTNWAEFEKVVALAALERYARESEPALSALRRMTNDESGVVRTRAAMYLKSAEGASATYQPAGPIDLYRNRES